MRGGRLWVYWSIVVFGWITTSRSLSRDSSSHKRDFFTHYRLLTPPCSAAVHLYRRLYDEYAVADRLRMRGWVLPGALGWASLIL